MKTLQRDIDRVKKMLLSLCALVEKNVFSAVKAVRDRDAALGAAIVQSDHAVDQLEVDIEEECLRILALHQPVAVDLRFIIAALKINNDLERIGDLAVNIAWRAEGLARNKLSELVLNLEQMGNTVKEMLRVSLEALVALDPARARDVLASDDIVDEMNRATQARIEQRIKSHPDETESLLLYMAVSRNLERIADHATNIAEDVIYMVDGDIVRHGRGRSSRQAEGNTTQKRS